MKQTAEFLGACSQPTVTDTADRRRVVGHDRHRELHTGAMPPFVTQLPRGVMKIAEAKVQSVEPDAWIFVPA